MHKADLIMDFQFGSTGKGLIAGYLSKRVPYDTAICAFATNAGHTYKDKSRGIEMMTQQLPTAISSPTVKNVLLGPGSAIHVETLLAEIDRYSKMLDGKRLMIHPHAAIVTDYHMRTEKDTGYKRIGSTTKGVGEAYIQRIQRNPLAVNVAHGERELAPWVVSAQEYRDALEESEDIIIEGAQGFSLSMYHGFYPYTTSRDVTPWQICADCGIPFKWASTISIIGTLRTLPIRVNNREGSSGPIYSDQVEYEWADLQLEPELTTVTKLPRRIFSFSYKQLQEALWHCEHYWETRLFLNFANYITAQNNTGDLLEMIAKIRGCAINRPKVAWVGWGPDDADIGEQK